MPDHDAFLSDEDEIGHLAEDVALTDHQFEEVAGIDDRKPDPGSGPTVAPPD
jgi:hypothetical protein